MENMGISFILKLIVIILFILTVIRAELKNERIFSIRHLNWTMAATGCKDSFNQVLLEMHNENDMESIKRDEISNLNRTVCSGAAVLTVVGSHLIFIEEAIFPYLSQLTIVNRTYWLGLRYYKERNEFRWQNGRISNWSNWHPDQPVFAGDKPCVAMSTITSTWKAWNCSDELPYVCHDRDRDYESAKSIYHNTSTDIFEYCVSSYYSLYYNQLSVY
ncbi:hypothetical protein LOTGIDRAFT_171967 [Lottia gigantea]|uniref:C-type lectin domain-containing protein n=1 Tax=Lottia gigantea TaxID=225164 RepID=V4CJV5_LOTGI|nr:hypothetical protein LOTGIDRAFT_171967 [Lottia gigantea]ESP02495.1 hypothetical protein LOTGIDRAFT_171967 [Lottia gigantea]